MLIEIHREIYVRVLIRILFQKQSMMLSIQWCLIFAVVPYILCDQSTLSITMTNRIIDALTRALQFFSLNIDQVNLDAGIGTRIAADQLRPYTIGKHREAIKDLVDFSENVTWKIAQSVRHRQADYYAQLSFLLAPGVFSRIIPFRFHQYNYEVNIDTQCSSSPFIEKHSDKCLHALAFSQCDKLQSCTNLMSHPDACHYSLTHQILYAILAKRSSCNQHQISSIDEHRMVLRMLVESQAIVDAEFPESYRDLFMEQIAFGGLLGWSEFFQDENWFESIISWQHPIEGCYGNDTNQITKREEMQMLHRCLSHRTSVAIAALSEILRYVLSSDI